MKNFTSLVFALLLVACFTDSMQAQNQSLEAVNNPRLVQKRAEATLKVAPSPIIINKDPMLMARKYETSAIREWRAKHPKVKCIPAAKFSALSPQQQTELASETEYIVFEKELRWADIEKYQARKK